MKESDREDLASSSGLEPYAHGGDAVGVASGRGDAGQPLSSEIKAIACRSRSEMEKATLRPPSWARRTQTRRSRRPCACVEVPGARTGRSCRSPSNERATPVGTAERSENVPDGTADTNANRKSDDPILPTKRANKAGTPVAESAEERGSPEGNAPMEVFAPDTEPKPARYRCGSCGIVEVRFTSTAIPEGGAV